MSFFTVTRNHNQKILLRGDSNGKVALWICPDVSDSDIQKIAVEKSVKCPGKISIYY